jgi:hypothetical protein
MLCGHGHSCNNDHGDLNMISEIKQQLFVYWSYFFLGIICWVIWNYFVSWSYLEFVCFLECNLEMHLF